MKKVIKNIGCIAGIIFLSLIFFISCYGVYYTFTESDFIVGVIFLSGPLLLIMGVCSILTEALQDDI